MPEQLVTMSPEQIEWSYHIDQLFQHAGEGPACMLLKQAVLHYRWPAGISSSVDMPERTP